MGRLDLHFDLLQKEIEYILQILIKANTII